MYFIPRNNTRLYVAIAGIRPLYRYLLTAICLGAITYAWLFGVYFRIQGAIANYSAEVEQKKQYCSLGAQARTESKKLQESLAYLRNELQNYETNKADASSNVNLAQLFDITSSTGLAMHSCSVEKEFDNEWYSQATVACECTGRLESVAQFFQACSSSKKLIACDGIRLIKNDNNHYNLSCSLNMYTVKPS